MSIGKLGVQGIGGLVRLLIVGVGIYPLMMIASQEWSIQLAYYMVSGMALLTVFRYWAPIQKDTFPQPPQIQFARGVTGRFIRSTPAPDKCRTYTYAMCAQESPAEARFSVGTTGIIDKVRLLIRHLGINNITYTTAPIPDCEVFYYGEDQTSNSCALIKIPFRKWDGTFADENNSMTQRYQQLGNEHLRVLDELHTIRARLRNEGKLSLSSIDKILETAQKWGENFRTTNIFPGKSQTFQNVGDEP